jgi:hypothetical protein
MRQLDDVKAQLEQLTAWRATVNDGQATDHTSKYFEHAATPNLVFVMDPTKTPDMVRAYADIVNENHAGAMNSFKNMFLGGGTDV